MGPSKQGSKPQIRSDSGLYIEIWNMFNVIEVTAEGFQNATCVLMGDMGPQDPVKNLHRKNLKQSQDISWGEVHHAFSVHGYGRIGTRSKVL